MRLIRHHGLLLATPMNSYKKKILFYVFGLILFSAVPLLAAEGIARLFLPFPLGTRHTYQPNPNWLYFHRPSSMAYEYSQFREFPPTQVRYDSHGFRGSRENLDQSGHLVFLLGDSFVEGRQVQESDTFVEQLNQKMPDRTFINSGCSGYTTSHYFLLTKNLLMHFRPKQIVIFFSFNDYRDNFVYSKGLYSHPEIFSGTVPKELLSDDEATKSPRTWVESSALLSNFQYFLTTPFPLPNIPASNAGEFNHDFFAVNKPVSEMNDVEKQVLAFTHRGLMELKNLLDKEQIKLTVVIIPLPTQLNAEEWQSGKITYQGRDRSYVTNVRIYQDRLMEFCSQNGIECHDLLPGLKEASGKNRVFLDIDGHFTRFGHTELAKILEPILK